MSPIDDGTRTVRLFHIQSGYNKALTYRAGRSSGARERRLHQIQGKRDRFTQAAAGGKLRELRDGSWICCYADKKTVYDYARCVELANLEILDICLDAYAMAQEAAVFEQAIDRYIVQVDLSR